MFGMQSETNTVDHAEVSKFEAMANEWWDPHGKFKPLHMLNPCRLDYITTQIAGEFGRDLNAPLPFAGLRLLDIGCGGGLLSEPMARLGAPDSTAMRTAVQLSTKYLSVIEELYEHRNWIAGGSYSLADIAAVAQISVLDYVDLIEWDRYPVLRRWYARVKSRRAMEVILADRIDGVPPPRHYSNVDF